MVCTQSKKVSGVWFPPKAFCEWQRFPPGSQVHQFKDTRWQPWTVSRSVSVDGCLSLWSGLAVHRQLVRGSTHLRPERTGRDSMTALWPWQQWTAGNKSNQAKSSLKSSSPATYAAAVYKSGMDPALGEWYHQALQSLIETTSFHPITPYSLGLPGQGIRQAPLRNLWCFYLG